MAILQKFVKDICLLCPLQKQELLVNFKGGLHKSQVLCVQNLHAATISIVYSVQCEV